MSDARNRPVSTPGNLEENHEDETETIGETITLLKERLADAESRAAAQRERLAEMGRSKEFGWARVSRKDQQVDQQVELLQGRGVELVFTDTISGAKVGESVPFEKLKTALAAEREPVLNVWRIDRLGRDALWLLSFVRWLTDEVGGTLVVVESNLRLNREASSTDWFRFELDAVLAARELRDIQARTRLRIEHKKKHGERLGRVSKVDDKKLGRMLRLKAEGYNFTQIGEEVGLSRTAVAKHIKQALVDA